VSEALADPSMAKRVGVRDGEVITGDGPFAEVMKSTWRFSVHHGDRDDLPAADQPAA
jgi:hypothetical protein